MKAISKKRVIDLLSVIGVDAVDNSHYDVHTFGAPVNPEKWYDCVNTGCDDLPPGAYCALWVDDIDCSNMPSVGEWIDEELESDNIKAFLTHDSSQWIILICLDLF